MPVRRRRSSSAIFWAHNPGEEDTSSPGEIAEKPLALTTCTFLFQKVSMPLLKAVEFVWQDREVRFDSPPAEMQCRKGEVVIDSINSVEDTKGNNGEKGLCMRMSPAGPTLAARYILLSSA